MIAVITTRPIADHQYADRKAANRKFLDNATSPTVYRRPYMSISNVRGAEQLTGKKFLNDYDEDDVDNIEVHHPLPTTPLWITQLYRQRQIRLVLGRFSQGWQA